MGGGDLVSFFLLFLLSNVPHRSPLSLSLSLSLRMCVRISSSLFSPPLSRVIFNVFSSLAFSLCLAVSTFKTYTVFRRVL
jgi:hypothetical protein